MTADPGKFLNKARARITEARALIERDWPEDRYVIEPRTGIDWDAPAVIQHMDETHKGHVREALNRKREELFESPVFWSRKKDLLACPTCFAIVHSTDLINHTRWHMG